VFQILMAIYLVNTASISFPFLTHRFLFKGIIALMSVKTNLKKIGMINKRHNIFFVFPTERMLARLSTRKKQTLENLMLVAAFISEVQKR
jgi:hypothetical protein